jgi:hypothetical protein
VVSVNKLAGPGKSSRSIKEAIKQRIKKKERKELEKALEEDYRAAGAHGDDSTHNLQAY